MTRTARAMVRQCESAERTLGLMSTVLVVVALAILLSVTLAGKAYANDLVVSYDQSQLLRLPKPVASVIVGNPSVADVTVQGGNLVVVTGKTFGVTNIIALDAERNVIQDQRIVVRHDTVRTVNLTKGNQRQSYSCTPDCAPTLTIGDDATYFDQIQKHATAKTSFSAGNSSSSSSQNNGE